MTQLLNFKNKNLREFPIEILDHKELSNLNLEGNRITVIPEWINELKNLRVLYLSNNEISDIEPLGNLKKLEVLHLSSNRIEQIPSSIGQLINLKRLYLNYNSIGAVNDVIAKLESLTQLLLASNKICSISENLGNLSKLEVLNLLDNKLEALPSSIGKLGQLEYLQISENKLKKLPKSISNLGALTSLELYSNQISSLGVWFQELDALKNLNIGDNKIKEIPNLPFNLSRLSIYRNPIDRLSVKIVDRFKTKRESDLDEYLFIDQIQLKKYNLNQADFGSKLKVVDLKNKTIQWTSAKHMPLELQIRWGIERERISNR